MFVAGMTISTWKKEGGGVGGGGGGAREFFVKVTNGEPATARRIEIDTQHSGE